MNRIDRLTAILIQLQSKKVVKASEIAERFDISLRTVYRDIRALEEAGVPIGAEAGVGYYIIDGYFLPPVMFTNDEANSLLLAAKLIEKMTDESISEDFNSALYKIKSILKHSEKETLDKLNENIYISSSRVDMFKGKYLSSIQKSITTRKVLQISYFSNYNEKTSEREIEPIGLFYYSNAWHLIAYCKLRKDYRDFRVDRIKKLKLLDEEFEIKDKKSLDEYIKTMFQFEEKITVVVRFKNKTAKYIGQQKYYMGFIEEQKFEDETEMKFIIPELDFFSKWLLMFGENVNIISPKELITAVKEEVKNLNKFYK